MKKRVVYCAECGMELEVLRKAVPSEQKIYEVVKPHVCGELTFEEGVYEQETEFVDGMVPLDKEKKSLEPKLDALFDSFKFVKKLNDLSTKPSPMQPQETGDKRDKEHLRKEIPNSTAPLNLLNRMKDLSPSVAENDTNVEPEGE